ncbi:MAG: type transport system ATP-binding protein [Chloroflexota bacterium]|nr:type transport system ATP-binding protein [Chloroflexota bacterium]
MFVLGHLDLRVPNSTDQLAVSVVDLVKRYPKSPVNAVDGASFGVSPGEVFGLLGPNGAGKTTTVGVLTTRVRPTGGQAMVAGMDVTVDPVGVRRLLAVVPQRSNLDRSISIRNNLIFHAAYHGVAAAERGRRADELLEQFGLLERRDTKPDFFSGGQAQRIMIARALMHAPRVLFLDEPTTGLDPAARLFVWERLRELRDAGVTLLLTTHDMDEAAELADRVAIMDRGKLLAIDTPPALIRSLEGRQTLELAARPLNGRPPDDAIDLLGAMPQVEKVERISEPGAADLHIRLYLAGEAPKLVAPAASVLDGVGYLLTDVKLGTPTLEDVFIQLTGRMLR